VVTQLKNIVLKYHRPLFYSAWLTILLLQSLTTDLFDDEAYYWVYSRFLDWGYFDHPPMIALLIKAGYALFHNALGVRLFSCVLTTAALFLTEELTTKKDPFLFYAVCASLAIAQLGGMMAVPDSPLMFFVALFFLIYRRFCVNTNLANTALLGIAMALMLYTKYQAVLVIFFTVVSNAALLRKYQSYLAAIITILLFLPHLYWQYLHDYPSVQFHLFERNSDGYEFLNTIDYIIGQILIAGPVTGWLLIWAAFRSRSASKTERALKFSLVGVFLFFLLSTIKGKSEANWTLCAFIGLIVLSHQFLLESGKWKKVLYKTIPLTLTLIIAARGIMMIDLPPTWWIFKDEFHGNHTNTAEIKKQSGGLPVVFLDSYQKPSKYWFYSGDTSLTLNTPKYRRNNFNFWPIEDQFLGRKVYLIGNRQDDSLFKEKFTSVRLSLNGGLAFKNFYSFSRVLFSKIKVTSTDSNQLNISFQSKTPSGYLPYFQQPPYDTAQVYLAVFRKKQFVEYHPINVKLKDILSNTQQHIVHVMLDLRTGTYQCKFALSSCAPGYPSLNSARFEIALQ
jgi:hypothetical protein